MPAHDHLTLDELYRRTIRTFRDGGGTRPEVSLVDLGEIQAVLKDYGRSDPWFRRLVGPLSTRREARALRQLQGVRGVPEFFARPTSDALLMGHLSGVSVREFKRGTLPAAYFDKLYLLVEAIHDRGVAHCDLRSGGNMLVGPNGEPYIVDFVANFRRGWRWNPLTKWMYDTLCEADRTAVARLKRKHAPALLTSAELAALKRDRKTPLERGARMIGGSIRNISRWLLTRRK
jgi:hypothetical protein